MDELKGKGIAQIKNHNFELNRTFAIENIVYNELLTRGYDIYIGKTAKGVILLREKMRG